MSWQECLLWQTLVASCILQFAHGFTTVQTDTKKPICANFICTRHSLKTETRAFVEDLNSGDGRQIECKKCSHCTDSGYSVCLQANTDDNHCLCAQEIPRKCSLLTQKVFKPVAEQQQMNICYASSLRNPPKPTAVYEPNNDLVVTIDHFWLKNYWLSMKLESLTLFYQFPVQSSHFCEGEITPLKSPAGDYLCTPMLKIELEEESIESQESLDDSITHGEYDNSFPKLVFELAVFEKASYVRFYYNLEVRRERQLNELHNIVERMTMLTSDTLTFNLSSSDPTLMDSENQVHKTSTAQIVSLTTTFKPASPISIINKVNIEQRQQQKAPSSAEDSESQLQNRSDSQNDADLIDKPPKNESFLEEYLNNGGQLQLIVCVSIVTLGVCLLLIVATFLYRRYFKNHKRCGVKLAKHRNGHEYRATIQDER